LIESRSRLHIAVLVYVGDGRDGLYWTVHNRNEVGGRLLD
jgi:hypothetical protein